MHSKEKDEACLSFLEKNFTKSVHRGGVECHSQFQYHEIVDPKILLKLIFPLIFGKFFMKFWIDHMHNFIGPYERARGQILLSKKMQITTEINEHFMIYESGQVAHY